MIETFKLLNTQLTRVNKLKNDMGKHSIASAVIADDFKNNPKLAKEFSEYLKMLNKSELKYDKNLIFHEEEE
jgi:hypothetical protein